MIEFLRQEIISEESNERKINKLREILQLLCLKILQDKKYFSILAFVGGTALRVLHDTRRFSEDLDFSVIDKKNYKFSELTSILNCEFELNGLKLEQKAKDKKTVQASMLKFPGLLNDLGISELKDQKLSIKFEIDSNPPAGWRTEFTIINKIYVLNITHFDLPSLYATKLHACFFRKYTKGRDFYDLVWYLSRRIKPNYKLLNNAIEQTEGKDTELTDENIKGFLLEKLETIDFKMVRDDLERFLEDKKELELLNKSVISKSIIDVFG